MHASASTPRDDIYVAGDTFVFTMVFKDDTSLSVFSRVGSIMQHLEISNQSFIRRNKSAHSQK
jgi:hypothetical protein